MPLHFNYLLFDAARAERQLYTAMEMNKGYQSLYKGRAEEDLEGVAPYLFSVKPDSEFMAWYMKEGMGQSWGVPLFANAAFEDVYKHFRQFLTIKTEEGQQLYFRFYDPRVLRIFLPTCDSTQIRDFFGPVKHYIVEAEEPGTAIQFWQENYELKSKPISLQDMNTPAVPATEADKVPPVNPVQEAPSQDTERLTETGLVRAKRKWKFDID